MHKNAFLFPGQGAQYVGMGRDFYDAFAVARAVFEEASDQLHIDWVKLIFAGQQEDLSLTKNSQVAIFIVSVAILKVLLEQRPRLKPTICAGLSLGEYSALFASKRIRFADCLSIVAARGRFMQEACQVRAGTMRVVLGMEEALVKECLPIDTWVANLNCPGQVVIAGTVEALLQAETLLKSKGAKRVLPLDVSGAFHTPLMLPAKVQLQPILEQVPLIESDIQLVMNVPGGSVTEIAQIRRYLIEQITHPTLWEKGIRSMHDIDVFIGIGPGNTLLGMNKKIGTAGKSFNIEKVQDLETVFE